MLTTNSRPLRNMIVRRPKRSDNMPANREESTLPSSTAATTKEMLGSDVPGSDAVASR